MRIILNDVEDFLVLQQKPRSVTPDMLELVQSGNINLARWRQEMRKNLNILNQSFSGNFGTIQWSVFDDSITFPKKALYCFYFDKILSTAISSRPHSDSSTDPRRELNYVVKLTVCPRHRDQRPLAPSSPRYSWTSCYGWWGCPPPRSTSG